jgi:hypothetical protein
MSATAAATATATAAATAAATGATTADAASRLDSLRQLLEKRFPDATPVTHRTTEQVASGIIALDRILPSGGFPRGRLTVWAPRGAVTAILRSACHSIVMHGERSAWIDGAHVVAGDDWRAGPILLKPRSDRHALRAAEELLRSGGFALVVLAGTEANGTEMVRLTRAAREGGSALVAVTPRSAFSSLQLRSDLDPQRYRWRRTPFGEPADVREVLVRVRAQAQGWSARTEFALPVIGHQLRMALEPGIVDRRGTRR